MIRTLTQHPGYALGGLLILGLLVGSAVAWMVARSTERAGEADWPADTTWTDGTSYQDIPPDEQPAEEWYETVRIPPTGVWGADTRPLALPVPARPRQAREAAAFLADLLAAGVPAELATLHAATVLRGTHVRLDRDFALDFAAMRDAAMARIDRMAQAALTA